MRAAARIIPLFLGLALPATGCAGSQAAASVELAGEHYVVELADDDEERARGLMFRDAMEADRGMLFIHDREERQSYWMKNTRIALDILYFDNELTLVSQQRDVPPCSLGNRCPSYPSENPARYVLELNAGEAARIGAENGMKLTLGPSIKPTD